MPQLFVVCVDSGSCLESLPVIGWQSVGRQIKRSRNVRASFVFVFVSLKSKTSTGLLEKTFCRADKGL